MLSHETCSAGGNHEFDVSQEDESGPGEIIHVMGCGKCGDVYQNEILVQDNDYEFQDCEPDVCKESENGHDWTGERQHDYCSPDEADMERCVHCSGWRNTVYRMNRTEYWCDDGLIHTESW